MQWGEALKAAPFVRLSRFSVGGVLGCIIGIATHMPADGSMLDDGLVRNLLVALLVCAVFACTFVPVSWGAVNRLCRGQPALPKQQMYTRMAIYFVVASLVAAAVFYFVL
jgi:hypothetical protein